MRPSTSARALAARVATLFLLVGATWILVSDAVLYRLTDDRALIGRVETAKGWTFVVVAALVLYGIVRSTTHKVVRTCETLSAVLNGIGDGVLILGAEGRVIFANPAATRLLGVAEKELVGMGVVELSRQFRVCYPDGRIVPPERFASQRVFDECGPIQYKAVIYPRDGSKLHAIVTAAAIREQSDAKPTLVVSVIHDVSAAETFDRMRDDLFAAAAHALRTPVSVIKGNAELLASGASSLVPRATAAIDRQCGRIDRLVDNLLVVARARSGTLQLHPVEVELRPLVEGVVAEMQRAAIRRPLRTDLGDAPRVWADPERLATALRDLIELALRSSVQGTPVKVSLARREGDVEVEVRYEPAQTESEMPPSYAEYDDLGTNRYAANLIVDAHGGTLARHATQNEVIESMRLRGSA